MLIIEKNLIKLLWLGVAFTLPLFGVSFFHLKTGFFHLAPPALLMAAILYTSLLTFCLLGGRVKTRWNLSRYRLISLLLFAFLVLHVVSLEQSALMQSELLDYGIKGIMKMVVGFLIFWVTIALFPREERFIEIFFTIACWTCSILLAVFIYRYAFIFHMPFMATEYGYVDRSGKNQMAVQTVYLFFYAFSYFFLSKKKTWFFVPIIMTFTISIVYLGSRMGWLATLLGLLYLVFFAIKKNGLAGFKFATKVIIVMGLLLMVSVVIMSQYVDLHEVAVRLISLYDPSSISDAEARLGKHTLEVRGGAILQALQAFLTSPITGVGIGNTTLYVDRITHNDFSTVLLELGLIGELLFLGILITIWYRANLPGRTNKTQPHWLSFATRAGFVTLVVCLNFFNLYLSPYFWFYLALSIVILETVEGKTLNEDTHY